MTLTEATAKLTEPLKFGDGDQIEALWVAAEAERTGRQQCPTCAGEHHTTCGRCEGEGVVTCSDCDGDGKLECSRCDGEGTVSA